VISRAAIPSNGHGYIQHDDIWFQSLRFANRFGSVVGFAADLESRIGI
jgi:hypothetical protein